MSIRAEKSKETLEVMQKVNEGNKDLGCPKCRADEAERLLSSPPPLKLFAGGGYSSTFAHVLLPVRDSEV